VYYYYTVVDANRVVHQVKNRKCATDVCIYRNEARK